MYGYILHAIGNLPYINRLLIRDIDYDRPINTSIKLFAKILGIFDIRGRGNNPTTKFVDRFNICKYFPGYLRNKEIWDKLRGHYLNARQFDNVITGKTDVTKGIEYYFNENTI